ncbi:PWI domain-containing protein [Lipomyces japonicus]|uniref:PWI domain-containing protein n=1 Tax=Lipomyces japonicus TaxID=56871 RepID=UPI0034CFDD69
MPWWLYDQLHVTHKAYNKDMASRGHFPREEATGLLSASDRKRLKETKYPPEFNMPVNMKNVNFPVIRVWIARQVNELANGDEIVTDYITSLVDQNDKPDIKAIQLQLEEFVQSSEIAQQFCKELWNILLEAQSAPSGIPSQLLEEKRKEIEQTEQRRIVEVRKRENKAERAVKLDQIRVKERAERAERRRAKEIEEQQRTESLIKSSRHDVSISDSNRSKQELDLKWKEQQEQGKFHSRSDRSLQQSDLRERPYRRYRSPSPGYQRQRQRSPSPLYLRRRSPSPRRNGQSRSRYTSRSPRRNDFYATHRTLEPIGADASMVRTRYDSPEQSRSSKIPNRSLSPAPANDYVRYVKQRVCQLSTQ